MLSDLALSRYLRTSRFSPHRRGRKREKEEGDRREKNEKDRERAGENVGVVVEDIDEIVQAAASLLRFVTSIRGPRHTVPHLHPEELAPDPFASS